MRALVVYESMFGNTEEVARAIADGLAAHGFVTTLDVTDAPAHVDAGTDVVVVGGPTHAFGMSRPRSRTEAAEQGEIRGSTSTGIREWLATVTIDRACSAAAFDTRIAKPRVPGSAARRAQKRLRRLGLSIVAPGESFYVEGTTGPLVDGELVRARRWGEAISAAVAVGGDEQAKRGA
jgi:hypothetical protein